MATIKDMASGVADKAGAALGKVYDFVKPAKKQSRILSGLHSRKAISPQKQRS